LAKCNAAAAFCDTHVHGAGFLRDSEEAHQMEKAYTIASQRGPEMPKAPKNAPPDQHASEAGLAVTPDDVRAAAAAIASSVIVTECDQSRTLSEICGCNLWLKFENLQFTSTFKERGALNRLLALSPGERQRGVIAMSAGNHAQGVAYHANRLGIPAVIVMPVGTPMVKIENTRRHGVETIISGKTLE
jgi:threonine dehydratase